jgi:tetratricopeptide (TPR) repeat protein
MATGERAFTGDTEAEVNHAIVNETPSPAHEANPQISSKLGGVINKALEKERGRRYQTIAEMRGDLEGVNARPLRPRFPNWKLYVAAAVLVAMLSAGFLYWRARQPINLTAKDTIIIAGFQNLTADPVMDDALDWPLIRELQESPYVNVLYPNKVVDALKAMNVSNVPMMPRGPSLTPDLAREVCLRTASRAFVTASIANAGNSYHIRLRAQDCHSGKSLANVEMDTDDRNQIVRTLGVAGHQLRRELGEPEDSLNKYNTPLENETSWSLEALHSFVQGLLVRDQQGITAAVLYYKRAVEMDPNLAMAYMNISQSYAQTDERSAETYITTAYNLRGRLSQRSRWFIEAKYYEMMGQLEEAIATFTEWAHTYPTDTYAVGNLSGSLRYIGQHERAALVAREGFRLDPNPLNCNALMGPLLYLNRFEEDKAVYDEAIARGIDGFWMRQQRYTLALVEHDTAGMEEQLSWAMARPESKEWALQQRGDAATYYGRLHAAREFYSSYAAGPAGRADILTYTALGSVEAGNFIRGKQIADQALAVGPTQMEKRVVALIFARAGAGKEAEKLLQGMLQESPRDVLVQKYELPSIRAAIELKNDQPARAVEILKATAPYELAEISTSFPRLYPPYLRGLAYLKLGQAREAAAEFQKMIDHPGIVQDFITAPLSHLYLARAQVMMGDKDTARKSYQDFLTLWKDADPDIPAYKQAKAEYAKLQ